MVKVGDEVTFTIRYNQGLILTDNGRSQIMPGGFVQRWG